MRLSDLFRDVNLAHLGVPALLLFFAVFVGAAIRAALRSRELDRHLSSLPLDDDATETKA